MISDQPDLVEFSWYDRLKTGRRVAKNEEMWRWRWSHCSRSILHIDLVVDEAPLLQECMHSTSANNDVKLTATDPVSSNILQLGESLCETARLGKSKKQTSNLNYKLDTTAKANNHLATDSRVWTDRFIGYIL